MNVMITGGCGYVGTILTQKLLDIGHKVVVVDIQWFGNYLSNHENLTVIKEDTRNTEELNLDGIQVIIHLANIANDPSVELNPHLSWEVNVLATMRLIDSAVRSSVKQFIFASSSSVYGVKEVPDVTENLELTPISEYNKTKMIAERVVLSYKDDIITQIIRPATVCGYSPRMRLDLSVNMLTMQALTKDSIKVFGGNQIRPNIHIQDLTDIYIYLIEKEEKIQGVYNAGFENLSIMGIAKKITRFLPAKISVEDSNDPRSYHVNSDKLLSAGFKPKKTVDDSIKEIIEAYQTGKIKDEEKYYNINWMKKLNL